MVFASYTFRNNNNNEMKRSWRCVLVNIISGVSFGIVIEEIFVDDKRKPNIYLTFIIIEPSQIHFLENF